MKTYRADIEVPGLSDVCRQITEIAYVLGFDAEGTIEIRVDAESEFDLAMKIRDITDGVSGLGYRTRPELKSWREVTA